MTDSGWSIPLSFTRPPLHLNQRMHWAPKAKLTKQIRHEVATKAAGKPGFARGEVTLIWMVNDKRRRDTDNPSVTTKACIDGLVDAGVFADDSSQYVVQSGCRIEHGTVKGMRLEVREA